MKTSKIVMLVLFSLIFSAVLMQQAQADCLLSTTHAGNISELSELLPGDARGALAVDISALLAGSSATQVGALLNGSGGDPALKEPFSAINKLAQYVNLAGAMDTAFLVQTTVASDGLILLAKMSCNTIGEVAPSATFEEAYGDYDIYIDANDIRLSMLSDGVLIVGKPAAVKSVLDVAGAPVVGDITPFLSALESGSSFSFVYGLPAMFNSAITADRSLRGAELVSGSLDFAGANISGNVSFHTSNASTFVDNYNTLNSAAIAAGDAELVLNAPIANSLSQVVVAIPTTPINKSGDAFLSSRNTLKKLLVGMEAYDYAEDVHDPGNRPWADLVVQSEEDSADIPGSVFIRWAFKDSAAISAFEAAELPAGFTLAPCKFLDTDPDEGLYFLTLNLYNVTGALFTGARAEWDVFVNPPVGADPNAGTRPRFMVIDALASGIGVDSVQGLTSPEPMTHSFVGDQIVTNVHKMEGDVEVAIFESSITKPFPTGSNIARFTREMAICNDYIYWGNGIYDRVEYNATTFNYDALFADNAEVQFTDNSHWQQYLASNVIDAVYYLNTLEYVGSFWANLDSSHLDLSKNPVGWLDELYGFKNMPTNYLRLMREAVRASFKGRDDTLKNFVVDNTTPAVYYNFQITDPAGMATALNLPDGFTLGQTRFFDASPAEDYYLTLSIYEIAGSVEGARAEWSVYADGSNGRERVMVIDLLSEDAALDPVSMINLPSEVSHDLAGNILSTSLSSMTIAFAASFNTADSTEAALSLDWIEAGDFVCHLNGICDKLFYDAETLDVPVHLLDSVAVTTIETPWNDFIDTTPSSVFYRDNSQEYVAKPWHTLQVYVEDAEQAPICFEGSHTIDGAGTLVGRTSSALDATYAYFGGATLDGNDVEFIIDQLTVNVLGESHIFMSGTFDRTTGMGTQTVLGCSGHVLVCSSVDPLVGTPEATTPYEALNLDVSDLDNISWDVAFELTIPSVGTADANSSLTAELGMPPVPPENCTNGVDDDCDGALDCADSDCSTDLFCAYTGTANAEAASYGSSSLSGSGTFNALTLFLVPVGAVLLWKGLRRKK